MDRVRRNFDNVYPSRTHEKYCGRLDQTAMDTGDENNMVEDTKDQVSRIDRKSPGLGSLAEMRLSRLLGAGRQSKANSTRRDISEALHLLSVPVAPSHETRDVYRGGSIKSHEIEQLRRNVRFRDGRTNAPTDDNLTVAYALMHGYMAVDERWSRERPPSVSTLKTIADEYTAKTPPQGAARLHLKIRMRGHDGDRHSAKGVTFPYQVKGIAKHELLLDDRNTYWIRKFYEAKDGVHVTVEAEGESSSGKRAIQRLQNPLNPASLSPEAEARVSDARARRRKGRTSSHAHRSHTAGTAWQQQAGVAFPSLHQPTRPVLPPALPVYSQPRAPRTRSYSISHLPAPMPVFVPTSMHVPGQYVPVQMAHEPIYMRAHYAGPYGNDGRPRAMSLPTVVYANTWAPPPKKKNIFRRMFNI